MEWLASWLPATDPEIPCPACYRPDHPKMKHLVKGVVAGIGGYGNCLGLPNIGGEVVFDECYQGNPLVNAMCVGLLPAERVTLIRGWFSALTPAHREHHRMVRGSVFNFDCDLYSSTRDALRFAEPLFGRSAIAFFDDWHAAGMADQEKTAWNIRNSRPSAGWRGANTGGVASTRETEGAALRTTAPPDGEGLLLSLAAQLERERDFSHMTPSRSADTKPASAATGDSATWAAENADVRIAVMASRVSPIQSVTFVGSNQRTHPSVMPWSASSTYAACCG